MRKGQVSRTSSWGRSLEGGKASSLLKRKREISGFDSCRKKKTKKKTLPRPSLLDDAQWNAEG